jgi:hypothetical protein
MGLLRKQPSTDRRSEVLTLDHQFDGVERCFFRKKVEEWMKFGLRTRVTGSLKSL